MAGSRDAFAESMNALNEWMAVDVFSLAVLCGAVLQIADKGIEVCSANKTIPKSCATFVRSQNLARYCIGRQIRGLPMGAIVHGGRNQDQHWNEEDTHAVGGGFHPFTAGVFHALALAYSDEMLMDLVYVLGGHGLSGPPRSRADSIVLTTLKWTNYDSYIRDMRLMLKAPE
jgi:hypothetical protein